MFEAIKSDLLVTHKQEFDSNSECIKTQCHIKGRRSLILGTYYNLIGEKLNSNDVLYYSLLRFRIYCIILSKCFLACILQ